MATECFVITTTSYAVVMATRYMVVIATGAESAYKCRTVGSTSKGMYSMPSNQGTVAIATRIATLCMIVIGMGSYI